MKFEEALSALREGKNIKLSDMNYILSMKDKIYYNGNLDMPIYIIATRYILRDDWEIVE